MTAHLTSSMNQPHLETVRVYFHRTLVAVDLSPSSKYTVKIAMELAERFGSQLVLVHVLDPALMTPSGASADIKAIINLWMKPYSRKGIGWTIEVVEGDLVHEMTRLVRLHRADLLVIGTHVASDSKRFAIGSKAEALFRHIAIPVLAWDRMCARGKSNSLRYCLPQTCHHIRFVRRNMPLPWLRNQTPA